MDTSGPTPGSTSAAEGLISSFRKDVGGKSPGAGYLPRNKSDFEVADSRRRTLQRLARDITEVDDRSTIADAPEVGGTDQWHIRQIAQDLASSADGDSPVKKFPKRPSGRHRVLGGARLLGSSEFITSDDLTTQVDLPPAEAPAAAKLRPRRAQQRSDDDLILRPRSGVVESISREAAQRHDISGKSLTQRPVRRKIKKPKTTEITPPKRENLAFAETADLDVRSALRALVPAEDTPVPAPVDEAPEVIELTDEDLIEIEPEPVYQSLFDEVVELDLEMPGELGQGIPEELGQDMLESASEPAGADVVRPESGEPEATRAEVLEPTRHGGNEPSAPEADILDSEPPELEVEVSEPSEPKPPVVEGAAALPGGSRLSERELAQASVPDAPEETWEIGDIPVVEHDGDTGASSQMIFLVVALGAIVVGIIAILALPATKEPAPNAGPNTSGQQGGEAGADRPDEAARRGVHTAVAFARSRATVAHAIDYVPAALRRYEEAAREAAARGDVDAAITALQTAHRLGFSHPAQYEQLGELLVTAERFREARDVVREGRNRFPRESSLATLLTRVFDQDPLFAPKVFTIRTGHIDGIKSLGGGSTITLKFRRNKKNVAAFKPHQTRRQSNYRSEIAAWRLCELLDCSFYIPYNRPVRISRDNFDKLYAVYTGSKQQNYAANFKDLIWQKVAGKDFIFGTEKEWVPDFTSFPIESTEMWAGWLKLGKPLDRLDEPVARRLAAWKNDEATERHYRPVVTKAGDLTTRELAHQLSDVLVFDFLVGNWDRFSTNRDWWGTNCNFGDGRIISIDNGAAFPAYTNSRVKARFEMVQRFSRSLIMELRLLDKEQTRAWLFPKTSTNEQEKFERFWSNRAIVLGRIDKLIEEHGEDEVLAFP